MSHDSNRPGLRELLVGASLVLGVTGAALAQRALSPSSQEESRLVASGAGGSEPREEPAPFAAARRRMAAQAEMRTRGGATGGDGGINLELVNNPYTGEDDGETTTTRTWTSDLLRISPDLTVIPYQDWGKDSILTKVGGAWHYAAANQSSFVSRGATVTPGTMKVDGSVYESAAIRVEADATIRLCGLQPPLYSYQAIASTEKVWSSTLRRFLFRTKAFASVRLFGYSLLSSSGFLTHTVTTGTQVGTIAGQIMSFPIFKKLLPTGSVSDWVRLPMGGELAFGVDPQAAAVTRTLSLSSTTGTGVSLRGGPEFIAKARAWIQHRRNWPTVESADTADLYAASVELEDRMLQVRSHADLTVTNASYAGGSRAEVGRGPFSLRVQWWPTLEANAVNEVTLGTYFRNAGISSGSAYVGERWGASTATVSQLQF